VNSQNVSAALVGVFTNKTIGRRLSTALVGVFTNKKNTAKQVPVHSPCWCFHQQEKYRQTSSRPQPLLVFSPTRLIPPNKFPSTALVGVFTNKKNTAKQVPVHSPC
jgi:reverse gyrase